MKKSKATPSQTTVPHAHFQGEQEYGGVRMRSDAIGVNRMETPARERIGTDVMPVPTEGAGNGGPEFRHDMHPASGKRRR